MEQTIKKINSLINWYENNSTNAGIDKLLDFQDKLAVQSYYLSEQLNKYHRQYINVYRALKWTHNKGKVNLMKVKEMSATRADSEMFEETEQLKQEEDMNFNIGFDLNNIIRSSERILKVCQQRISYLKMEYDQTKKQNMT